jgi:hypothetical protein
MNVHPLQPLKPAHPILRKLLHRRPQLHILHIDIIHCPDPRDQLPWIPRANAVHQRAADRAEVVRHIVPCGDCLRLGEDGEFVLSADVGGGGGEDDEIGCEGGGVNFVVVAAGADEGAEHVRAGDGLGKGG